MPFTTLSTGHIDEHNRIEAELANAWSNGVFDVRKFGALGDNDADDTAACQAAIDAAEENQGGLVWFPPGLYRVTQLRVKVSGVYISGSSKGQKRAGAGPLGPYTGSVIQRIAWTPPEPEEGELPNRGHLIILEASATGVSNITLVGGPGALSGSAALCVQRPRTFVTHVSISGGDVGLLVDRPRRPEGATRGDPEWATNATTFVATDCFIVQCDNHGIWNRFGADNAYHMMHVYKNKGWGFYTASETGGSGGGGNVNLVQCHIAGNGGRSVSGSSNGSNDGSDAYLNSSGGVYLTATGWVSNCRIEHNGGHGIQMVGYGKPGSYVGASRIYDNGGFVDPDTEVPFLGNGIHLVNTRHARIVGNDIRENDGVGIRLQRSISTIILGNQIYDGRSPRISDYAISVDADSVGPLITSNIFDVHVVGDILDSSATAVEANNVSLVAGTVIQEWAPPVAERTTGLVWEIPSMGHSASWSGTAWTAIQPSTAAANLCCILGNECVGLWDASLLAPSSTLISNRGGNAAIADALLNGSCVIEPSDSTDNKVVQLDGIDAFLSVSNHAGLNFDAAESMSAFIISSQPEFVAGKPMLAKATGSSGTGYGITNATGVPARPAAVIRDTDVVSTSQVSAKARPTEIPNFTAMVRNVSDDTFRIYNNAVAGTAITDTTAASLTNTTPLRVGRYGGSSTNYTTMGVYVFGIARTAWTADQLTLLNEWYELRFL